MSQAPLTLILPVRNVVSIVVKALEIWLKALEKLERPYRLIVVDDASTDSTVELLKQVANRWNHVQIVTHEREQGFGGSLQTALAMTTTPLIAYSSLDYPYTPNDLAKLLKRVEETDVFFGRPLDLVSGCRTGHPKPPLWAATGWLYRNFCRVLLGYPITATAGWLGFRMSVRTWISWLMFGSRLEDPESAFKIFRKELLAKFPLQSQGGFVHTELLAKSTFTTCLLDELPLTSNLAAPPIPDWRDFWMIVRNPIFTKPKRADVVPSQNGEVPVEAAPDLATPATPSLS